jgi:hypothetical protein
LNSGRGQVDLLAVLPGGERGGVDLEVCACETGSSGSPRRALTRRAGPRDELGELERLRHIVVRAELEPDDDVHGVALAESMMIGTRLSA